MHPFARWFVLGVVAWIVSGALIAIAVLGRDTRTSVYALLGAGILSVDPGQSEAAQAIGMNRAQAMRRVILPQAMRVIVPPTGNETIAMLKDTSLLIAIPLGSELFFQLTSIGSRTYRTFEVLVAAVIFYLIATSVLMVGQYYIERHYARGSSRELPATPIQRLRALLSGGGTTPAADTATTLGRGGGGGQ